MATTTTNVEHFAFDGPINVVLAVVLGCALLWLFAWSLRRERGVIGSGNVVLFWLLRAAALAVAVWMLLAPTTIHTERSIAHKSIAMVVDVSRSMQTVDPIGSSDELRWALSAGDGSEGTGALAAVDRAVTAAGIAERRLHDATTALQQQQPERVILESAVGAGDALDRVRDNGKAAAERLARPAESHAALADQARRILSLLDGSEFRTLADLAAAHREGKDAFAAGWRESLPDLEYQLAGVRRRLTELSRQVAQRETASSGATRAIENLREAPRIEQAAGLVESVNNEVFRPLSDTVDVRHYGFDDTFTALSDQETPEAELQRYLPADDGPPTEGGLVTDLSVVLEQMKRDGPGEHLAAVFLVTDAAHNHPDSRSPRESAGELSGTPVYVVPIGNPNHVRDVDLKSVYAPSVVMKDDDVVIEANLQAYDCRDEVCRVELWRDGGVIQHRDLVLDSATATRRARFDLRMSDVGTQKLQVRVAPLAGELSEENNFEPFEINVTRNHIKVLLADERPRWEYRYLTQLFRRDAKVACDELLFHPRMIATGHREESRSFPTTGDDWARYDVVLLGDVATDHLPVAAQESLVDYLRDRGGTLVMIAGDTFMPQAYLNQPLHDVLPVEEPDAASEMREPPDGYAFEVTETGWEHQALMIADSEESTRTAWSFINRHAPLHSLSRYRRARPSAHTLIAAVPRSGFADDAPQHALLCWQAVGRGRIVYLASPETWRLRYLRGDRLHYRFWGQLLRWAIASELGAGGKVVTVRTDKSSYEDSERVEVVVQLNDVEGAPLANAELQAVAIGADDAQITVPLTGDTAAPGRYLGQFENLDPGIYRVEPIGPVIDELRQSADNQGAGSNEVASFTVRPALKRELLDTRCDRALAQQIADVTGGQVLPPTALAEVVALTDLEPVVSETTETLPLWVQWKYLWIVFGCLFSEWVVRKRMGLS